MKARANLLRFLDPAGKRIACGGDVAPNQPGRLSDVTAPLPSAIIL